MFGYSKLLFIKAFALFLRPVCVISKAQSSSDIVCWVAAGKLAAAQLRGHINSAGTRNNDQEKQLSNCTCDKDVWERFQGKHTMCCSRGGEFWAHQPPGQPGSEMATVCSPLTGPLPKVAVVARMARLIQGNHNSQRLAGGRMQRTKGGSCATHLVSSMALTPGARTSWSSKISRV